MSSLPTKVARAVKDPRRTFRQAEIAGDVARLRAGAGRSLRAARPRRGGRGNALIISLTDFVYQLKLEGMLAKALQLDGYDPVVLTFKNARWAEPYFRSFGVERFVYHNEILP